MKRLSGYDEMTVEEEVRPLWRKLFGLPAATAIYVGSDTSWTCDGKPVRKAQANRLYWFWISERRLARQAQNAKRGRS